MEYLESLLDIGCPPSVLSRVTSHSLLRCRYGYIMPALFPDALHHIINDVRFISISEGIIWFAK